MALIAFASAKGSPGVSVTVAGLAHLWPTRAVVADLDPAGGDTGLRYRADNGDPLNPSTGLLSLGAAVRAGQAADLEDHLQTTAGGMRTLVGVTSPGPGARSRRRAWQHIALTLRRASGVRRARRLRPPDPGIPAMAVLEQADAVVLVSRASSRTSPTCASGSAACRHTLHLGSIDATPTGIAMVTSASDTRGLDRRRAAAGLGRAARARRWASSPRTARPPTRCAPSPAATSAARCWCARCTT